MYYEVEEKKEDRCEECGRELDGYGLCPQCDEDHPYSGEGLGQD